MKSTFRPLLLCPCIILKDATTFRLPKADVEIGIPAGLAKKLVKLADGTHTVEWLIDNISGRWSKESIRHLIVTLHEHSVLIDGQNISPIIWEYASNPSSISPELDDHDVHALVLDMTLQEGTQPVTYTLQSNATNSTLSSRSSTRIFGLNPVSAESLGTILWSAYGLIESTFSLAGKHIHRRTVPSGGALYPILIHLVLFTASGPIMPGVYRVTSTRPGMVDLHLVQDDAALFKPCFVNRGVARNAAGTIIISGAMDRSTSKYGNRGILYTLLEAGHATQNTLQAIIQEGIAALEVGGFFEKRIQNVLDLPLHCQPLTTIVFGSHAEPSDKRQIGRADLHDELISQLEVAPRRVKGYTLPFDMVFAEVNDGGDPWWSCGRAVDPELARTKAIAEAVEWHACGMIDPATLTIASYEDVKDHAINPLDMARYLHDQFKAKTGLRPFKPNTRHAWHEVTNLQTGEKRLVLADFIFFPYAPDKEKRYAFANSSGCACHTTIEQATESALLELVEREAFMATWLNRLTRSRIAPHSLPSSIQRRLKALRNAGFETTITDLTYDLTPVPFVMSIGVDRAFATCSAASDFDVEVSLDRTLMEVEASVYCHLRDGVTIADISPEDVHGPEDHALLYESATHIHRVHFLRGNAKASVTLKSVAQQSRIRSINDLLGAFALQHLTPYVTELGAGQTAIQNRPFKVVRAIVPGMVPATFGYDLASLGLSRVRSLPQAIGRRARSLTKLNRFPHPFG